AVRFDALDCPGEVLAGEQALPEIHDPGGVRGRRRGRRFGAALCRCVRGLHPLASGAGPRRAWDGCVRCADRESLQSVPRTDVWPFPAILIPAGTVAAADSWRVDRKSVV